MATVRLLTLSAALMLHVLPKACAKKDEAADAGPSSLSSSSTVATSAVDPVAEATTTAAASSGEVKKKGDPVRPVGAGAASVDGGRVGGDAGPLDAGAPAVTATIDAGGARPVAVDAGHAPPPTGALPKGLPPRVEAPVAYNGNAQGLAGAAIVAKIHTRDALLNACYLQTGQAPDYWSSRCYHLAFGADGRVTGVTGGSQDALGTCVRAALTGLALGTPRAAGEAGACFFTR